MANQKSTRVLIIRPTALGDVARSVPILVTLRRAMPEAHIDWLVNETFVDVVRHHPDLNGIVSFPRKRFGTAWRRWGSASDLLSWSRILRKTGYDLVFDLQGLFRSGFFSWLTGADRRVGFANAREGGWLGYNRRHNIATRMHAVDRMLGLVEAEGLTADRDMTLYVGQEDRHWLKNWRQEQGLHGPYLCIAPTARWRSKCWPIERYTEIAQRLLRSNPDSRLVILASPQERDQIQPMIEAMPGQGLLAPQTTVGQLMAILSQTRLLICNDSAPLHLAVGFDRPIVALFGPTDPALVGPYRRDDCVIRPSTGEATGSINYYRHHRDDQSLIARISVDAVWEKVLPQL